MPASITPPRRKWTLPEFNAARDAAPVAVRHELVDGDLLLTPAPGRRHQAIVLELGALLKSYVRAQRIGAALVAPFDVRIGPSGLVQPDVVVISREAPYDDTGAELGQLILAVEVLSPGSARHDRVIKRAEYQRVGVPEYWIVDGASLTFERWQPSDDRPEILGRTLQWEPPGATLPFILALEQFFIDVDAHG